MSPSRRADSVTREKCWYRGCDEPICEADKAFQPHTAKYCDKHSKEADAAMDNPADALAFFLKSDWEAKR